MKVSIGLHRDHIDDWDSAALYASEAEKLGVDSVWSAEAWGYDGITPLAYLAGKTETIGLGTGIIQGGTRTPALIGMTALEPAIDVRRTLPPRTRHQRTAGD